MLGTSANLVIDLVIDRCAGAGEELLLGDKTTAVF